MPIFTWEDNNLGFYRYGDFEDYEGDESADFIGIPWPSDFNVRFNYFNDGQAFDETEYAAYLTFEASGVNSILIDDGDNAGDYQPISGTIDTITYYNTSDEVILTITEASIPLAWAARLEGFDFRNMYDFMQGMDNTYIGAKNGTADTWDDYEDWDDIDTGSGDDVVRAGGGNDYIKDGGGSDEYRGGSGDSDTLTYDEWYYNPAGMISGITADLRNNTITGPDGEVDSVYGIENIYGTWMNDHIDGGTEDNRFRGYLGEDYFNGRGGFDVIDYSRDFRQGAQDGVKVNMRAEWAIDGFGTKDTYDNVEGARGTDKRDLLRDDDGDNYLRGEEGNDFFRVRGGDDYLRGDEGADEFRFISTNFGDNTIRDFNPDEGDFIYIKSANSMADLTFEDQGSDVLVTFNANSTIRLENFDISAISSDDFTF